MISRQLLYSINEKQRVDYCKCWDSCHTSVVGLQCLLALPRASLEPPHAVVPLVLPLDHNGTLSDRQSSLFAILLLAQDQVWPRKKSIHWQMVFRDFDKSFVGIINNLCPFLPVQCLSKRPNAADLQTVGKLVQEISCIKPRYIVFISEMNFNFPFPVSVSDWLLINFKMVLLLNRLSSHRTSFSEFKSIKMDELSQSTP